MNLSKGSIRVKYCLVFIPQAPFFLGAPSKITLDAGVQRNHADILKHMWDSKFDGRGK